MNNFDKILNHINNYFLSKNINFKIFEFGSDVNFNNDQLLKNFFQGNHLPFKYSFSWIEYLNEYFTEKNKNSLSLFVYFIKKNQVIGYWPITILNVGDKFSLSTFGYPVYEPYFISSHEDMYLIERCAKLLINLKELDYFNKINVTSCLYSNSSLNRSWDVPLSLASVFNYDVYDLDIDLTLELSEIKSYFRKSYKSIINKTNKNLTQVIYDSNNISVESWMEIKNLHKNVAGKKTRSDKTWDLQYQMIKSGRAFSTAIYDNKTLIAASLFGISKFDAFYFIGVYNRDMEHLNLGHHSLYLAITKSKQLNLNTFNLGTLSIPSIYNQLTEKELSIEHFKKGFASQYKKISTFGLVS